MRFYVLYTYPKGDFDTEYTTPADWTVGDASSCPRCGATVSMLAWLPPFRVELRLYGTAFGNFVFMPGSDDFLVSQKFRDVYFGHGFTGLCGFDPVDVVRVKSRRKKIPKPPTYFRVSPEYGGPASTLRRPDWSGSINRRARSAFRRTSFVGGASS